MDEMGGTYGAYKGGKKYANRGLEDGKREDDLIKE
jgi:hypothetical protein